jgi:hypothetical protein
MIHWSIDPLVPMIHSHNPGWCPWSKLNDPACDRIASARQLNDISAARKSGYGPEIDGLSPDNPFFYSVS